MSHDTLDDIYARFAELYANSEPIRSKAELDAAIVASSRDYGEVDDDWLRSLDSTWVYQRAEEPFSDERANRAYRRELQERSP
jgi:hypothetical protein